MNKSKHYEKQGSDSRILLTGVFGPFAQDDEFGSRRVNPMELYHNQVTRVQGPFSLRMFHRTFGLMMIEANIEAPCTLLEFPTLDRFIDELKHNDYEVVGINSIVTNIDKVKKMCEEIRKHLPKADIVIGGHIANIQNLDKQIDVDYICQGDGIQWFREYLGQDVVAPIKHPAVISGFGTRVLGMNTNSKNTAATLIPSVGCPLGCNFCSTSSLFGGKGKSVTFYDSGDELFSVLCQLEEKLQVQSFFVLDENFLLYKKRSLRLLELMEQNNKSWSFYVFSSARVLQSYKMEQLISLGISWIWLGLEGSESKYSKLNGVDTRQLIKTFQENGIRVLGSTIIGMEEHTPENIDKAIDFAVSHDTDFHQFMLYTPLPGTPLFEEHKKNNTLLSEEECPTPDVHGQERFNFKHQHIKNGQENGYLLRAFEQDFKINGPSVARITKTTLQGWKKYKNHPEPRIRARYQFGKRGIKSAFSGALWAMIKYYKNDPEQKTKLTAILQDIHKEFGIQSRFLAPIVGTYLYIKIRKEEKKLAQGWTYEPNVIYEKNARALALEEKQSIKSKIKIPQIKMPVYDLNQVLNHCREQVAEATQQFHTKRDQVSDQIKEVGNQMTDQIKEVGSQMTDQIKEVGNQMQIKRERTSE